ncbi:MAG TPA: RDD family protein [Myxococcota bacterium]|nr:RDD family protein [Myxococcota bacterium]
MTPESPYAPPQASLRPERAPEVDDLASTGQRFADYLIDSFATLALYLVWLVIAGPQDGLRAFLSSTAIPLVYYFALEATLGQTLGKLVTGVRVVSEDGKPATAGQIARRTLSRLIPFEALTFLGSRDGRPVGWHDSLAHTRVIRAR